MFESTEKRASLVDFCYSLFIFWTPSQYWHKIWLCDFWWLFPEANEDGLGWIELGDACRIGFFVGKVLILGGKLVTW